MNKTLYTKWFNVKFFDVLAYIRNKYKDNLSLCSKIDTIKNNVKSSSNRIIINLFDEFILEDETICNQLTNKNIKFFETLKHEKFKNNKVFNQLQIIFSDANGDDKKYLLIEVNGLRKITKLYVKSSE